jgi:hypothetical protein
MKTTNLTLQQISRAIRKIADKFPPEEEAILLTDVHIRVAQDTGELVAYDDDDREITRCIIEEWIDSKDEDFYEEVAKLLRKAFVEQSQLVDAMSILKPYSFVLENDELDLQYELYVVDGDTVIINPDLMEGLNNDLDDFLKHLMKD